MQKIKRQRRKPGVNPYAVEIRRLVDALIGEAQAVTYAEEHLFLRDVEDRKYDLEWTRKELLKLLGVRP